MGGICIGAVYFAVTLSTHQKIGSAVNPALSLPHAILNSEYDNLALYLTTPFIGSLIGVFLYTIVAGEINNNKKVVEQHDDSEMQGSLYQEQQLLKEEESRKDVSNRFIEDESEEMIREE